MHPSDNDPSDTSPSSEGRPELVSEEDENLFRVAEHPTVFPPRFTEQELLFRADYEWCLHDPAIRQQYAGQVVAASHGRIWGAGDDHGDALQTAQRSPGCPPREEIALVYIEAWPLPANLV